MPAIQQRPQESTQGDQEGIEELRSTYEFFPSDSKMRDIFGQSIAACLGLAPAIGVQYYRSAYGNVWYHTTSPEAYSCGLSDISKNKIVNNALASFEPPGTFINAPIPSSVMLESFPM